MVTGCGNSQKTTQVRSSDIDKIINVSEVTRIENILAADDMKGRKTFSPEIDKAADFIANEFKTAGLQIWSNIKEYKQEPLQW